MQFPGARVFITVVFATSVGTAAALGAADSYAGASAESCLTPGAWHILAERGPRPARERDVIAAMAGREVVLFGEQHDDADHHRWQLQTLAALHAVRPDMVIGFESFPRRVQPALDEWVAGKLSVQQFLERTEWAKVWGVSSELYLPLFHFARMNRVPMVALNVERSLIASIGKQGWDNVPVERREGLSRPARASAEYETYLFDVYREHAEGRRKEPPPLRTDARFRYFVESQTTWDRAMAETLAARVKAAARPLVVGIMGSGHVRHGYGVPHQLRDLGVTNVATFVAIASSACEDVKPTLASAVFALPPTPQEKATPQPAIAREPPETR